MTAHQHPIDVRNKNLCELSKAKKLDILKVAELRKMCESLELEVSGSLARKKRNFFCVGHSLVPSCGLKIPLSGLVRVKLPMCPVI